MGVSPSAIRAKRTRSRTSGNSDFKPFVQTILFKRTCSNEPGGVMKSERNGKANHEVGVELKYCEHCGSLWVRERGAGTVYCDKCQLKVAELPAPKVKPGRLMLPVRA